MPKNVFTSKTFWTNIIAVAAMIIQGTTGKELMNMETQAVLLGIINIILRSVTKEPVSWK